jgi:hypothetical protein
MKMLADPDAPLKVPAAYGADHALALALALELR